ncbi:hypothetical protein [Kitasatospora sp. NPDC097691]|uniref:hypothetical protein n=1 Tax=Kitasatospora sp. NPDC097691 TaxID=3157231 RepID=UPI00331FFB1A
MNLRTKKTLGVLLRGAIIPTFWTVQVMVQERQIVLRPAFFVFLALLVATTGYAWWWYGDSPKAVAYRAKAEAKKAARQQSN